MTISSVKPIQPPQALRREMAEIVPPAPDVPGLIAGADDLVDQHPRLKPYLPTHPGAKSTALVLHPAETGLIFGKDALLDFLRTLAGEIGSQVHPHIKTGIDALWLVYKMRKFYAATQSKGSVELVDFFKIVGLALDAVKLADTAIPALDLPDHWSNGVNFIVKAGESYAAGKAFPGNELLLSQVKPLQIPLKALKVTGIALDPHPAYQNIKPVPLLR